MATDQVIGPSRSSSVSTASIADESSFSASSSVSSSQSTGDKSWKCHQNQQKTEDILKSGQDSVSKLYQLYQIGAVRKIYTQDGGCHNQQSTFTVGVGIDSSEPCFVSTMTATSKKKAKLMAATKVLDHVKSELQSGQSWMFNCPLPSAAPSLTDRGLPTKAQAAIMAEDHRHRELLNEMTNMRTISGHDIGVLSIDLEQYDQDHSITLEIGISFMRMSDVWSPGGISSQHFIIHDREHLVNGRYCADNRANFVHGQSQRIVEAHIPHTIRDMLDHFTCGFSHLYLVGHTVDSDIRWLRKVGIELGDMKICDIGRAYRAIKSPRTYSDMTGMEKILHAFDMDIHYLHNGGNDARYNLEVLKKLMDLESPLVEANWSL